MMSHFYGTLKGNRGEATRCGSKSSGITTHAASWDGAVRCRIYQKEDGTDQLVVELARWHGRGKNMPLYIGPVNPEFLEIHKEDEYPPVLRGHR